MKLGSEADKEPEVVKEFARTREKRETSEPEKDPRSCRSRPREDY